MAYLLSLLFSLMNPAEAAIRAPITMPSGLQHPGIEQAVIRCGPNEILDTNNMQCAPFRPSCPSPNQSWVGSMVSGRCVDNISCQPGQVERRLMPENRVVCVDEDTGYSGSDCTSLDPLSPEYDDCINDRDFAEARRQAQAQAEANLQNALQAAISEFSGNCSRAYSGFDSSCSSLSPQAPDPDFSSASTADRCRSIEENAKSIADQNISQINSCVNRANNIQGACPLSTGTITESGSATVGSQTATVQQSGESDIAANQSIVNQMQSLLETLSSQEQTARAELNRIGQDANRCVSGIEGEPYEETETADNEDSDADSQYTGGGGGVPPTTNAEKTSDTEGGELADGGFGFIPQNDSFPSDDSLSLDSFTSYKNSQPTGTLSGYGSNRRSGGGASTSRSYGQRNTSFNTSNDPFVRTNDAASNLNNANNQAQTPGAAGRGFPGGGAVAGGLPPGANNRPPQATNPRSGARRALAKAKQLIGGYKRGQQEGNGAGAKRAASARGTLSPKQMKFAYQKAVQQYGRKIPLKFNGSKYVPDLRAIKSSREFKRRNARAVAMYEGRQAEEEQSLEEKMIEEKINPNEDHRIFKTMNIYFRRNFERGSQANGIDI